MARKLAGTFAAVATVAPIMAAGLATVSLGSPIASAATQQVTAPAGLTWHNLKLINGWAAAETLTDGIPRWSVSHGIVYLAGALQTGSTNQVFAVLPRAARPAHSVTIQVYTYDGIPGDLEISTDGTAQIYSQTFFRAGQFTSLAGVSFPVKPTVRKNLNLLHGWAPVPGTGHPADGVVNGIVYLSGAMRRPIGTSTMFARLPGDARPAHVLLITISTSNDNPGVLKIEPNGAMYASGSDAQVLASLDGVSYPLSSVTAHKLKLLHGWKSSQVSANTGNPTYAVRDGVVYLSGSLHQPVAGGSGEIGILPPGTRPAHYSYFLTSTSDASTGVLYVEPDGQMWLTSSPYSNTAAFTSLASISFPVKS